MDDSACHCADYSRAELLRATMTSAIPGSGLPSIERGMPAPAGTGLSRRSFLARSGALAMAVFGGAALAPRTLDAVIEDAIAAGPTGERVLVSIFLSGGFDSLSLLAPVEDPAYAAARPTLRLRPEATGGAFGEDARLHWHPNAAPLRDLHAAGKLTVIPAIGYDSPNHSHFTSRHFWEVGELDPGGRVGWLGRYLDRHGSAENPLQGLSLSSSLSPSLAPATVPVAAVSNPASFGLSLRDVWDADLHARVWDGLGAMAAAPSSDPGRRSVQVAIDATAKLRGSLGPMSGESHPFGAPVAYPESTDAFPRRLSALARMLELGLPLNVVALNANGGYDTHDNQARWMPQHVDLLARSLAAFQADLEARGLADRVLVHVWSEFGRRVNENGTGTDHGAGGTSLLMGSQVSGRILGEWPGLGSAGVDRWSNVKANVDFRAVYASIAEQWLGVDAAPIVPDAGAFGRYALLG